MSITRLVKQRLHDMLVFCDAIMSYTADISYVEYLRDEMRRDAVERRLGIIGEALHRRGTGAGYRRTLPGDSSDRWHAEPNHSWV